MINKLGQCESSGIREASVYTNKYTGASQAGFTLLELMISLGLGIAISWVVLDIALTGVRNNQDVITSGEVTENGRYLSNFLENELNHAGFYGQSQTIIPTGTGIPTRNTCTTSLSTNDLLHPIDGKNNVDGSLFCGIDNILPDSDLLIIRRASTGAAIQKQNLEDDQHYVQSNMDQVVLGTGASKDTIFTLQNMNQSAAPIREFYEDIYYVDTSGNFNRRRLVGGSYVTEPLAAGVDDFQVQYHIDTNDEHFADIVREIPDSYDEWKNVMSVSTFFLIRSTTNSNQTDAKTYNYGGKADISFDDSKKRRLFTSAAALDLRDPTTITVSETFIANFSFEDNVTDYYTQEVEGWTTWTGGSQNDSEDDVSGVVHKDAVYYGANGVALNVENYTGNYAVWIWYPSSSGNTRVEVDTGLTYEVIDNETSVYEFTVDIGDTSWEDPGDGYNYGGEGAYSLQIKVGTKVLGTVFGGIPDADALTTVTISSENFDPKPNWTGNIKLAIENTGPIEILADNVTGTKTTTTINQF